MKVLHLKLIIQSAIFFVALSLGINCFAAEKISVVINADAGYPPYSYMDKANKPAGIYYEVLQKIFHSLNSKYSITIRPLPWNEAVDGVKNGTAFAVYPVYNIPESRPWMDYSDSILEETVSAFCHKADKKWPIGYSNAKIGINFGFAYPKLITDLFRKYKMQVYALDNNAVALSFFNKNKIDCYINDKNAVVYTNNSLLYPPIKETATIIKEKTFLGFSKVNGELFGFKDEFIRDFNLNLRRLNEAGIVEAMVNEYLYKKQ